MKAVIMAGGEGKRLRPLTCTLPKPMAKILGKPIIEYIFDLLISGGVTEAGITLGYLPHVIEKKYECGYKNLKLDFIREDEPLGTAGGVRNAAEGTKEPFIVISGDALCGFDLNKIMAYHKASGAMITVVAVDASDPREYGIVKVDAENRVVGFIEKPSWSQAVSNLANTGVYIVNPECLNLIPKGKKYDFAADLFPLMLERNMPIYCYHSGDYWCDAGNIEAYLKCQHDALDGKIIPPINATASGVYAKDGLPKGDYSIVPPVYIGSDVEIFDGAVIGPYAVIDDGCSIGAGSKIRHATVLENCCIGENSAITGSLICSGVALKKRVSMFENSVAGSGCVIGDDSCVKPGIHIWPGKTVGSCSNVLTNVKYGSIRAQYIEENGMCESGGIRLTPETCVHLGAAVVSTAPSGKIAVAYDGTKTAEVMQLAIMSGIADAGGAVWNFGECFEAQFNFLVNFCGIESGLFALGKNAREVKICGEGGLTVTRNTEREIESRMHGCEFRHAEESEIKEIADMSSAKLLYGQELIKTAPCGLQGIGVTVRCENEIIKTLFWGCLSKLGVQRSDELVFEIDKTGTKLCAENANGRIEHEKLIALWCMNELKNGRDISVPYYSPDYFDSIAGSFGRKVYRYLTTPADDSDAAARKLASKQVYTRDGLFLAVKLLSVMKESGLSLDELLDELPEKYIVRKTIEINFQPSYISAVVGEKEINTKNNFEGIKFERNGGKLLIIPQRNGKTVRIFAEADTMEAASELCADVEDILNSASDNNNL